MKNLKMMMVLSLVLSVCQVSWAADEPKGGEAFDPSKMTPEMMLEMMKEAAAPTDEHKMLKSMAGTWKCECEHMMPTGQSEKTEGKSTIRTVMGGRYIVENFEGEFMGQPMKGMGLVGYDKNLGKFVGTWIDNFNTGIMSYQGSYDPATKTMVSMGEATCPMGPSKCKMVMKMISSDEMQFNMSMSMGADTEMQPCMSMHYTRTDDGKKAE